MNKFCFKFKKKKTKKNVFQVESPNLFRFFNKESERVKERERVREKRERERERESEKERRE